MSMQKKLLALGAASITLLGVAHADDSASDEIVRNQRVIDKVIQMGEHLRTLKSFSVTAAVSQDVVLENGQKIKYLSSGKLLYGGKNLLRTEVKGDRHTRTFYYNGKQLTIHAPRLGYYATVDAPSTLAEMVETAENKYGMHFPMTDLFLFGKTQEQIDAIRGAAYVGPSTINGKLCDHLAFRQDNADWQLWVTRSDKPLPCMLVITSTDQPEQPEYVAVYSWDTKTKSSAADFTFVPGKKDMKIPLKNAAEASAQ
ncbi:DUF2092 domain-containing protein [Chitinilyticum aquatile]|uniref:DUF2092 domain-containing protein n=1 Tax=Chitinilyticum aquatile TaxID=362520 RepID=UPI000424C92F|nr:DUF2092 domain-containing protein [Chitinilyticum aquatile]